MYKALSHLTLNNLQMVWKTFFHNLEKPTVTWSYDCFRPRWYSLCMTFVTGKDKLREIAKGGSRLPTVKQIRYADGRSKAHLKRNAFSVLGLFGKPTLGNSFFTFWIRSGSKLTCLLFNHLRHMGLFLHKLVLLWCLDSCPAMQQSTLSFFYSTTIARKFFPSNFHTSWLIERKASFGNGVNSLIFCVDQSGR